MTQEVSRQDLHGGLPRKAATDLGAHLPDCESEIAEIAQVDLQDAVDQLATDRVRRTAKREPATKSIRPVDV